MTFNKTSTLIKVLFASALVAFASGASAAMITGDITFSGNWDSIDSLRNTTLLSFPGGDVDVDGSNGDFSGIAQGDMGTINDLDFSANGLDGSVFVSIGGFDFVLDSLTIVLQNSSFLLLEGTGVVSGNGIMATPVGFTFSANTLGGIQDFSAGFTAQPIPVPGALVLFGSALAVFGLRRR